MIQFDSIKYELPQAKANLTEVGDSLRPCGSKKKT